MRQLERHPPSERVADDGRSLDAQLGERFVDRVGQAPGSRRVLRWKGVRAPEPGQVESVDSMVSGESRCDRRPRRPRGAKAVKEDQRGTVAQSGVGDALRRTAADLRAHGATATWWAVRDGTSKASASSSCPPSTTTLPTTSGVVNTSRWCRWNTRCSTANVNQAASTDRNASGEFALMAHDVATAIAR